MLRNRMPFTLQRHFKGATDYQILLHKVTLLTAISCNLRLLSKMNLIFCTFMNLSFNIITYLSSLSLLIAMSTSKKKPSRYIFVLMQIEHKNNY